jgi:hypothetical protein
LRKLIFAARRRWLSQSLRNEGDAAWAAWRNGLWSYRLYQQSLREKWLRRAFQELVVMDGVWSGEVTIPGVPALQPFDAAASAADSSAAKTAGGKIIEGLHDPIERSFLRLLLAARASQTYNDPALANAIFDLEGPGPEANLERLFLSTALGPPDADDRRIMAELLTHARMPKSRVLNVWLRSSWLFDGASNALLKEVIDISSGLPWKETKVFLREALALAFQLDDKVIVRKLLNDHPELKDHFSSVLPLAPFMLTEGLEPSTHPKSPAEYAELYEKLQQDTASVMETIRDKRRSLAVVGNSPCERGQRRGRMIDAHDLVTRFNVFSTSEEFAADYGTKCNIHVRSLPEDEDANEFSMVSDTIVLSRADLIYRNRQWKNILELARSGAKLSAFPTGFHQGLYKKLGGAPSSGIAFCALVKQERGVLSRASCFGFAFVDQIGAKRTSAHYFRDARPSFSHQWKREKEMFDELTASSPGHEDATAAGL